MKHIFFWLTRKLMRKQKLRTLTLFLGILFSTFLLSSFCGLGYEFWMQVHESSTASTEFDSTQLILISLITVLLLLVISCSSILLHNLFSLTFLQKWKSLDRLMTLGATQNNIIVMVILEISVLYCIAAPLGQTFSYFLAKWIGVTYHAPSWMTLGILLWILVISLLCGIRPAIQAIRNSPASSDKPTMAQQKDWRISTQTHLMPFTTFMSRKYYLSNRRHYLRIILTILSAILLYVPASYLINTNLQVHRRELDKKYGIEYGYSPQNFEEMMASLHKYQNLASVNTNGDSLVYVELFGQASLPSELLSDELITVLRKAGWQDNMNFETDSSIYFLEDKHYQDYLQSCKIIDENNMNTAPAILVNNYRNCTSWNENVDSSHPETTLLHEKNLNLERNNLGIKIYYNYNFFDVDLNSEQYIIPQAIAEEDPKDLDLGNNVTLVLPLSQLEDFCISIENYWSVHIYGFFQDKNAQLYDKLNQCMDADSPGQLRYTRKIYQEWFDSMHSIHAAMISICAILFFIALLNVFCTMIFQYFVRKKGLAILWSLGQTEGNLIQILILESMRSFVAAIIVGIPVSNILCYYIYNLYRSIWYIDFSLPWKQITLIVTAAFIASAIALFIDWYLMRKQNYLQDIRDIS